MRPDLEDYEELNEGEVARSRAMSWLVLVVAVGGFAALAYYAYHSGSKSMREGQVLVVQADPAAIKEAPADPQGEAFPNQDKTIYDAIAPGAASGNVEKLLPEPEAPVMPAPAAAEAAPAKAPATTTYVNKLAPAATVDPVDAQAMKQPAPAPAPESKPVVIAAKPVPVVQPVQEVKEVPVATAAAPAMVNVKPTAPAAAPVKPQVLAKPVVKPVVPKPAPAPLASGTYKVQLGAFKSDAEARQQWAKLTAKHGDVLKGAPIVVKADLPNGTFYRLRAGGFASADAAKAACTKLGGRGQGCFFAGK